MPRRTRAGSPSASASRSPRALRRESLYGAPLPGPPWELPERDAWPEDARVRVGTSGWSYRHWLGRLYPRALAGGAWLAHYARRLATVEVNSTYRRTPSEAVVDGWRDATPPGFRFSIKAPGLVTHEKRLVDVGEDMEAFLALALRLKDRLGVVLVQLPPGLRADVTLLRDLLAARPPGVRYAVELRHRSWFERDVRDLLEREGVAFVVHDFGSRGSPVWATSPVAYLRLHGASGRYRGSYPIERLLSWAEQVRAWEREGREVWCYLNNDERGRAVQDAWALRESIAGS